jgi:integral membrane sensor domain MASE1
MRVLQNERAIDLRRFPALPWIGALTVVYFIVGKLALKLAFVNASVSPVMPSAGIALAALLVLGYRTWPAIFLGAFLVSFTTTGNIGTSLGIAIGNTFEAVCGVWLVNRFAGGAAVFERADNVFKFAAAVIT